MIGFVLQFVFVVASVAFGSWLLPPDAASHAFLPGIVGGLIVGGAKKLLGKAAKNEVKRIAARGGALSGPAIRTTIAGAGGGGIIATTGTILRKGAGTVAGAVGIGAAADALGNRLGIGTAPRKKYRRMQYTNQKALKRSIRRVQGFEKLVKETFAVAGTFKPKKRRCR